jgi:glucose/arabinose dehydrogenase
MRRCAWRVLRGVDMAIIVMMLTLDHASGAPGAITTQRVAEGLNLPVYVTAPPGDTSRLFIIEKRGVIRILDLTANPPVLLPDTFLNIDSLVIELSFGLIDERGLLGLAFHPNYTSNGCFYVYYINNEGHSVISRYTASPPDSNGADPASALVLKTIEQQFNVHMGGCMQFGPDGYLYVGMGDGGYICGPNASGQNTGVLQGKMLRLDVDHPPAYIPASNPFVGPGNPLDEIWSIGFRNPWRFSFDRATGDLYIGDVGHNTIEEINYLPAGSAGGENFGWPCCEGTVTSSKSTGCVVRPGCFTECEQSNGSYVAPIHTYPHDVGISVIGGHVYRGRAIPGLHGHYFFADFGSARIWSFRIVDRSISEFTERTQELAPGGGLSISLIASFGEDAAGELYIVEQSGTTTGEVYRIVPLLPACAADIAPQPPDGVVNVLDLLAVIGAWGPCGDPGACPADIAPRPGGDGTVNVADLLAVITNWGPCN